MANAGIGDRSYYETHYASRTWEAYQYLLDTIQNASRPGPILDVGSGVGYLVEAAARRGLDCVGVEGSSEAIAIARKRYPTVDLKHHVLSDPLPFPDESFQTVVVNQVIEHLEPDVGRNTIAECYRVLVSGGMILVESPSRYNTREREADPTHIHLYSPSELKALLVSVGFGRIRPRNQPLSFLGTSGPGRALARHLFRLTGMERMSATASCIAYKPEAGAS